MPLRVECHCGSKYSVQNKLQGKKIRCPECGDVVLVRGSSRTQRQKVLDPNRAEQHQPQYDNLVHRPQNGNDIGNPKAMIIGGSVLAVSLLVIVTIAIVKSGNPFASSPIPLQGTSWSPHTWKMATTHGSLLAKKTGLFIEYHAIFFLYEAKIFSGSSMTGFAQTIYTWRGEIRKNGTAPTLKLVFSPASEFDAVDSDATAALKDILSKRRKRQKSFRAGNIENGRFGELNFVRCYWTATDDISKPSVEQTGVEYLMTDGSYITWFSVQDSAEHAKETLPSAEAMVQSFRASDQAERTEKMAELMDALDRRRKGLKMKEIGEHQPASHIFKPGSKYDHLINSRITEFGGKQTALPLPSLGSLSARIAIPKNWTDPNNKRARFFHPDAKIVFSDGPEPFVAVGNIVYNPRNGSVVGRMPELAISDKNIQALSRDGKIFAQPLDPQNHDFVVRLYSTDIVTKQETLVYDHDNSTGFHLNRGDDGKLSLRHLKFLDNNRLLAAFEKLTVIWDLKTGNARMLQIEHEREDGCAISEDGKTLAVANDNGIGIYDISTGLAVASMENLPGQKRLRYGNSLAFSSNGDELAALVSNHLVVWNQKGKIVFLKQIGEYHIPDLERGLNVQWLLDGSGWIVGGKYFLDRKSKTILWQTKPWHTFSDYAQRVVGDGLLTTICRDVTGTRGELITIPIPKNEIEKARQSIAGKTAVPIAQQKKNRFGIVPLLISDFTKW